MIYSIKASAPIFMASLCLIAGIGVADAKKKKTAAYHSSVPKPTVSNIPYGAHKRQVLDFWKAPPASADKPAPLVFYIHGGSWKTGSKEIINGCVDVNALLNAGISVAAINYRYVTQAEAAGVVPPVKAPLEDAARALQFVRSKAEEAVPLSGSPTMMTWRPPTVMTPSPVNRPACSVPACACPRPPSTHSR